MKFSLTTFENIRQGIKTLVKQFDYLSLQIIGTAKYGYYIDRYYEYSRKSSNNAIKRAGEELYNETSLDSRENVTIGSAFLSVYDYFAATSNIDIYNAAIIQGNEKAFAVLVKRGAYNHKNILEELSYGGHTHLLNQYLYLHPELANQAFYNNLLCLAVNSNHDTMLKIALDHQANLTQQCYNKSVLALAVRNNYLPNAEKLIKAGANISTNILEYGYYDKFTMSGVLPYLISQGADVNYQFKSSAPVLMYAILGRQYITAIFLIEHHANLNFLFDNESPLSAAINFGTNSNIIKSLILHGADVDIIVNRASILEDLIRAPYISSEDKVEIIPLILCNGHYSHDEVGKYIKYAKTDDIKSALETYTNGENMVCSTAVNMGNIFNTTPESLLSVSFAGKTSFENITDSGCIY